MMLEVPFQNNKSQPYHINSSSGEYSCHNAGRDKSVVIMSKHRYYSIRNDKHGNDNKIPRYSSCCPLFKPSSCVRIVLNTLLFQASPACFKHLWRIHPVGKLHNNTFGSL